jgi:hypothetical protein
MLLGHRSLVIGACALMILSGCGSSSTGSSRGTVDSSGGATGTTGNPPANPPGNPIAGGGGLTGSIDSVVATASVGGVVSASVGGSRTLSITYTSSDGNAITGFGISNSLGTLPAGWSGPTSFTCALVSTGSGCVLNLTFTPTAAASGSLTLDYVFVDNATLPSTGGTLTVPYSATAENNVVAAGSPAGQINAVAGGDAQSVNVSFTTDDGNVATGLVLTSDLTALPPGWSSAAPGLSCAIVSTGSGCQLALSFAPGAAARATLTLNYSYTDDSGTAKTGVLNIPYAATSQGDVVAAASPAGQINAIEKTGGQAVAVAFTTDDGKPATGLYVISDLTALAPGWSSASKGFSCVSVSTGNGCELHLTYAPAALTSGTLTLNYGYDDAAGTPKTGSLNLDYAATTNDNVAGVASPTGQINAVVGQGAQAVSVTFTTDDARTATALQLTSSLAALPAGWSSTDTSFTCSGLSSGNGCQLPLMYVPTAAGSGTLTLTYAYKNNAGAAKTGSVNIAYRATTNDNIVGTPSQTPLAVVIASSTTVNIVFTTDDGNLANHLSVTSNFAALPSGWSSAVSSFACAAVSTGTGCQLSLTYAPTATATGTLSLTYGYDDDSGTPKTGSVNIPYTATP